MKAAVVKSDRYEPIFKRTFLEHSQYQDFIIDPAVAHHPQGKATVEMQIPYVRENFFKGEEFTGADHVQREALKWCTDIAGMRVHGTTRKRPRIFFEEQEKAHLLPLREKRFDIPKWDSATVHLIITFVSAMPFIRCRRNTSARRWISAPTAGSFAFTIKGS